MTFLSKLAGALLLMASGASFAAVQTTAHPAAPAPATAHATTAPAGAPAAAKTDLKAEKKQIKEHEKTALAACKTMKGAEKTACKREAHHKASVAMADLKTRKHG